MKEEIKIRKGTKYDESEILKLWIAQQEWHHQLDAFYFPRMTDEMIHKMRQYFHKVVKSRTFNLFVAEVNGEAAGFIVFKTEKDDYFDAIYETYGKIDEIYVNEAYRRRGVGQALMTYADNHFRKKGIKLMLLLTSAFNDTAHEFYKKLGYEVRSLKLTKKLA